MLGIDAATWSTLSRLLDEALDLPPDAREAWLSELPPVYRALVPRLRDLLSRATTTGAGGFLRTLPKLVRVPLDEPSESSEVSPSPGDEVGPYRLVRAVAEGGMGSVWLAERVDGLVQRPVALKLPRGSWDRAGLAERMAREREILATLNHPHVARLYDAGVDSGGQPYLALEYVEGRRIDLYAREERLDTRARIHLFLQVVGAVAHAHSRLVVHRDLKPSNVLVTAEGQARLLDFGIAKILEGGLAVETELTRAGGRALTPAYASPEQLSGAPIGVGADIYSLGAVLFELLAESRPYLLERESLGGLVEAVLHAEPPRPSQVAVGAEARRTLRGDLDTIILKALKKRPAERYATANAFAEDLERWLQGRPVLAQPDRLSYRLRKFVGRNRLAASAAAAVTVSILVGAGLAIAEKARTDEARAFLASIKPGVGLDAAERAFLQAHAAGGQDARDPTAIETRFTYGRALAETGQLERGIAQMLRAEGDAAARFGVNSFIVGTIMSARAGAQLEAGEFAPALEASTKVMRVFARMTRPNSYPYAAAAHRLGVARLAARRPDQALPDLTLAFESQRDLLGAGHERTLAARTEMALALALLGRFEEAEAEIASVVVQPRAGDAPLDRGRHVQGVIRRLAGDPAGALRLQQVALATVKEGPTAEWPRMRVLTEVGLNRLELGALEEAETAFREALPLFERRQFRISPEHADALVGLGRARLGRGDPRSALPLLEKADRFWSEFNTESRWAGEAALWLGRCEAALGREVAERTLARAERLLSKSPLRGDLALAAMARLR
jgi:serine/threonine protein kinase